MGKQANGGSGGIQENKRWSLIHSPRLLAVLLVISMIHVAASTLDQGIRSPRYAKTAHKTNTQSSRVCNTKECIEAADDIKSSMNLTVDPCDDFYEYACGKWPENNQRPPGYSYYSSIKLADLKSEQYKKRILETATIGVNGASTEVQQMPSDLYKSCMDIKAIDNLGTAPLRERITELGGWDMSGNWDEDTWNFSEKLLSIHKITSDPEYWNALGPVFRVRIIPDLNDNTKKALAIFQAAPAFNKQEYLPLSSKKVLAYRQLIIDVVVLLGGDPKTTANKADEIIRFEAQLANVSSTVAEVYEAVEDLVGRTLEQLQREVPEFDWSDYLNKLFAPHTITKSAFIAMPASLPYLKEAMKIIQNTPKRVLANYMVWSIIQFELNWLAAPFRKVKLKYQKATEGTTSEKQRSKTCVDEAFHSFGDVISAAYVNERYTQLTRPKHMAKRIVGETIKAFKENVNSLAWLDEATRSLILEKADGLVINAGFPDYMLPNTTKIAKLFKKYKGFTITTGTYFKNKVSISKRKQQHMLKGFRERFDKTIWEFTPLNGEMDYYYLSTNTLTLPAAILQPPILFPSETLRAFNLGNLGSLAASSFMQAFGISGRGFDKNGIRASNFWSNRSVEEFNTRVKCYVKQYSGYKILGKWPIDGENTAEQNVGDNGGLKTALKAYYNWAKLNPSETWLLPGMKFTNEQLFYIGFAQKLCSSSTPEFRSQRNHDVYADDKFRINGPLANSCEFAKAFKCKKNSPMNPIKKCYLWSKEGSLV